MCLCVFVLVYSATLEEMSVSTELSPSEKAQLLVQLLSLCCDSQEVSRNYVLQQLLQYRLETARCRARRFLMQEGQTEAAAAIPAPGQQLRSDMRPFTRRFAQPIESAIDVYNRMVGL